MIELFKFFYVYNPLDQKWSSVHKTTIEKYREILPICIIDMWQDTGFSSHKDGFIWMVNPDDYRDIITQFIPASENLHVIIRTAFGGLVFFDASAAESQISGTEQYNYLCPIFLRITPLTSDLGAVMNGWLSTEEICSQLMLYNLYRLARNRLSVPTQDECYGFSPAIALGGDINSDNLNIYKIKEHLFFLSQLT